jgi:hypothetical protein
MKIYIKKIYILVIFRTRQMLKNIFNDSNEKYFTSKQAQVLITYVKIN